MKTMQVSEIKINYRLPEIENPDVIVKKEQEAINAVAKYLMEKAQDQFSNMIRYGISPVQFSENETIQANVISPEKLFIDLDKMS